MSISLPCDFCEEKSLERVYTPLGTRRGIEVMACRRCGLLQSVSNQKYTSRPKGSTSSDADRSSFRYTKDIILEEHTHIIEQSFDLSSVETLLDIGSNRGAFLLWVNEKYPNARLTGVEPDGTVVGKYSTLPNLTLHIDRIENCSLPNDHFDFVYCAHTLEHVASASDTLFQIHQALKPGAIAFLAVPNTTVSHNDIVEEIFIDPHTFHFNYALLRDFLEQNGFRIIYSCSEDAREIIFILERSECNSKSARLVKPDPSLYEKNRNMIEKYRDAISTNRKLLEVAGKVLNSKMEEQKLAIWGTGRILDALVKFGNLDLSKVTLLIDKYLHKYMGDVHGHKVFAPEALRKVSDSILVFVASRNFEKEIIEEVSTFGEIDVLTFGDLMNVKTGMSR